MRVDRQALVSSSSSTTKRPAASGTFRVDSGEGASRPASAGAAQTLGGIDSLLVLQGEGDATERRKRSLKHGNDLLDALDRLKASLLTGRVPAADLKRIVANLRDRIGSSGDPGLDEVIAHIEMRAQIELAKLKR
jgi:hypothetical protein